MKSYILLRNNKECGPYNLEELNAQGLSPTDLVWVEGESQSWQHPAEIPGVQTAVKAASTPPKKTGSSIYFAKPPSPSQNGSSFNNNNVYIAAGSITSGPREGNSSAYFADDLPERKSANGDRGQRGITINVNLFGLTVLLIGGMLCAFVVKRMLDSFNQRGSVTSAQAQELKEEILSPSFSVNTAKTKAGALPMTDTIALQTLKTDTLQNIAATITKPTIKTAIASKRKPSGKIITKDDKPVRTNEDSLIKRNVEKTLQQKNESEQAKTIERIPSLQVTANDYGVGMFGGISNLELTVANPSTQPIEKAVIEVDFLKPNGNSVKTQTVEVENIPPAGVKKLAVPSSNRGVKVRFRVVSVRAKQGG